MLTYLPCLIRNSQTDSFPRWSLKYLDTHMIEMGVQRGKNSKENKILLQYSPESNKFESFSTTKYRILFWAISAKSFIYWQFFQHFAVKITSVVMNYSAISI